VRLTGRAGSRRWPRSRVSRSVGTNSDRFDSSCFAPQPPVGHGVQSLADRGQLALRGRMDLRSSGPEWPRRSRRRSPKTPTDVSRWFGTHARSPSCRHAWVCLGSAGFGLVARWTDRINRPRLHRLDQHLSDGPRLELLRAVHSVGPPLPAPLAALDARREGPTAAGRPLVGSPIGPGPYVTWSARNALSAATCRSLLETVVSHPPKRLALCH